MMREQLEATQPDDAGFQAFLNPLPGLPDDWSKCSLGPADEWPLQLQAYCLTLESFAYPAAIFWGEEFVLLHNHAWTRAGGLSEQCQPQRGSLTADAWEALQSALHGGKQRMMMSNELLRDEENPGSQDYTVLISPLFGGGEKPDGVMAQLIPPFKAIQTMRRDKPRIQGQTFDKDGLGQQAEPKMASSLWDESVDGVPLDEHPFFHRFAEMLPSGLAILDHKANAVFVNQNFYQLTTHKNTDRSFTAWPDSIHPDDRDRVLGAYQEAFKGQRQLRTEYRAQGDQMRWRLLLLTPLGNENLQHVSLREYGGFVCSIVDITSEKSAEVHQREVAREARERKEQQERFIDMISHEIRNPLSAIMHCMEDIEDAIRNQNAVDIPAIHEASETIGICVSHQQHIVDDVLSFSKLDSSMLSLVPRPCQPSRQLNESLKMFQPQFRKDGVDFGFCIDKSYEDEHIDWVMADYARIGQILVNLVSNAIKFTARVQGEKKVDVIVGVSHTRPASFPPNVVFFNSDERAYRMDATNTNDWGEGDQTFVLVAVKDTGIGISDEGQRKLFQRFRQATPKTEESYGGSGLGLMIARKICHLHGGEIGVSSKEGDGTTFGFFFKVRKTHTPKDQKSNQEVETRESEKLQDRMEDMGLQSPDLMNEDMMPDSVESPPVERTDDITPDENGEHDKRYNKTIEIAKQVEGEAVATLESEKSQTFMENERKTKEALANSRDVTPTPQNPRPKLQKSKSGGSDRLYRKSSGKRVLLVEDNIINQKIVHRKLQSKGFVVTTANNGREAIDRYDESQSSAEGPYDIILMDQEMPICDGNAATRAIREMERGEEDGVHMPILGVSANVRSEQIEQMLEAGMDDVIPKPYKIDEMTEKIARMTGDSSSTSS